MLRARLSLIPVIRCLILRQVVLSSGDINAINHAYETRSVNPTLVVATGNHPVNN